MKKPKLPKPKIKFNGGIGAILCNKCSVIIKENLSEKEFKGLIDIIYCSTCTKIVIENHIEKRN